MKPQGNGLRDKGVTSLAHESDFVFVLREWIATVPVTMVWAFS